MAFLNGFLKLHRAYVYAGTGRTIETRIAKLRSAKVDNLGSGDYRLYPNFSFSTLVLNQNPGLLGINVLMKVAMNSSSEQAVVFTTVIRPELYFNAFALSFFTVEAITTHEWQLLVMLGILSPIILLWFRFISRLQERRIVDKTAEELNLIEIATQP